MEDLSFYGGWEVVKREGHTYCVSAWYKARLSGRYRRCGNRVSLLDQCSKVTIVGWPRLLGEISREPATEWVWYSKVCSNGDRNLIKAIRDVRNVIESDGWIRTGWQNFDDSLSSVIGVDKRVAWPIIGLQVTTHATPRTFYDCSISQRREANKIVVFAIKLKAQ